MTQLKQLIAQRRSVRKFTNQPVPSSFITEIVEAGRNAPSACNRQPWRFYVLLSEEAKAQLQSCYPNPWFKTAQVYILCVGYPKEAWCFKDARSTSVHIDTSIAVTHMMLRAEELGLSSTWVCNFDRLKYCSLKGWNIEEQEPISVLALGWADVDKSSLPHLRKDKDEVVVFL